MTKCFSTKSEDREWDYVVIGSGMGGLTTAAALSMLGNKVLVVEQHYVPGGFTHTFKRRKWTWDVGVHAVGEVTEKSLVGRLLKKLTQGALEWTSLGPVYDEFHFPDGFRIDFPDDRTQWIANLKHAFPAEGAAIDKYIENIRDVAGAMKAYYVSRLLPRFADHLVARKAHRLFAQTTQQVLDSITANARLKTVLAAQWGYYGSPPERSSFAIHALVVKHFWHGGYYPVGGAKRIADTLMQTIADSGGWTRIATQVREVMLRNGRAVGVRLDSGEEIRAKAVVSAAGGLETVQRLLPPDVRWARSIKTLRPSPAHVCLNIGFNDDIRPAGASAANKWFYEHWDTTHERWDVSDQRAIAPVLYTSFPALKDPLHTGLPTGEVVTFVDWKTFAPWEDKRWKKRGADYEALKADLSQRLLDQLLVHMPALKPKIAFTELSTPLSTAHFTRAAEGAIYGIEPTPARFQNPHLRPRTPIKGLFLSGGDMATVGVIGAFVGGILAAAAADKRTLTRLLA